MSDEMKMCSTCNHPEHEGKKCDQCDCDKSAPAEPQTPPQQ